MKTSIPSKTTALALNQKAIEGVDKYLATVKTVTIAGDEPAGQRRADEVLTA